MEFPDLNKKDFHKHLKEKLDGFSAKAPVGLWSEIVFEMNQQNSEKKEEIDELIKSAAVNNHSAPEFIWYGIEQKLNLDNVWEEMQPRLDKMRSNYRFGKVLGYLSVAALLLLFVKNCEFESIIIQNSSITENLLVNKIVERVEKKELFRQNPYNGKYSSEKSKNFNLNSTFENKTIFPLCTVKSEEKPNEIDLKSTSETKLNKKLDLDVKSVTKTKESKTVILDVINLENSDKVLFPEKEILINETVLRDLIKQKTVKYNIGLVSSIRTTVFIDDQNSRKLNRINAARVDFVPNLTFNYGVQIGAQFCKHGFNAEFWYNNRVVQEYRYTLSGRRHSDITKIDYLKINILYRPQLLSYGNNKIFANAGLYISNLKGVSYSSTRHNFSSNSFELSLWENGLILGLGQEHEISKHFSIDYGFRNEIGLSGIFKSGKSNILNTRLMGFSAFISLRIRL